MAHQPPSRLAYWLLRWLRPRETTVLRQVNLARRALGKTPLTRLPVGQPRHTRRCPLAQALGGPVGRCGVAYKSRDAARRVARVWGTRYERRAGRYLVFFPPALSRFVQDYDLFAFPHLVPNVPLTTT